MKSIRTRVVALACVVAIAIVGHGFFVPSHASTAIRSFEFTYVTRIPALPPDAKSSRIWIPLPQSDGYQTVSDLKIESPFPYAMHRDFEYGNAYLYLEIPVAKIAELAEVRVRFQVLRR